MLNANMKYQFGTGLLEYNQHQTVCGGWLCVLVCVQAYRALMQDMGMPGGLQVVEA